MIDIFDLDDFLRKTLITLNISNQVINYINISELSTSGHFSSLIH